MAYALSWMPEVLEAAGVKVAEVPGWASRGRGQFGTPEGVMIHHTATKRKGNMPTLGVLRDGRSDLSGPLSQLGLGRDGTFYVIAAGSANHAGGGRWQGIGGGNRRFIGIEVENSGGLNDLWPDRQVDALVHGTAALLKHIQRGADRCCGHGEYALPSGRKTDPHLNFGDNGRTVTHTMDWLRGEIELAIRGDRTAPPIIPASTTIENSSFRTLRRGDRGDAVDVLQGRINATLDAKLIVDGIFGAVTEAKVRQFQRTMKLVPDGIVGPLTWAKLLA